MASKKGIGITVAILVGIAGASFLVYLIPEDTTMKFVVSDFEKHLDDIDERTSMLSTAIEESFEDLMNHKISPDEYFITASVTQSQVNSLIIELTVSGAPQEWTASYITYVDALKKLNEQIRETVIVANLVKDDNVEPVNEIISKIHELRIEISDLVEKSDSLRP
jgi:hypothetical protein